MSTRDCSHKKQGYQGKCAEQIYYGAIKASYFVTEERDISPKEIEHFETLFAIKKSKK